MAFRHSWTFAAGLLAAASTASIAQTVTPLTNLENVDYTVYGFQLTDGTLLYQGGDLIDWWKYTPDQFGNYQNGTWSEVASLPSDYIPYATSGGVLADGRVVLIGGEYLLVGTELVFELTDKMAVYDPVANTWTEFKPPAGWAFIGDSPWSILADGRLLLGQKTTKKAAVLDPNTLTWTEVNTAGKHDFNAEEGWTLQPDGSVLTLDVKGHPHAERFLPNADPTLTKWVAAGMTPTNLQATDELDDEAIPYGNGLVYYPPGEIGPAILRPDGTTFATGAVCPQLVCVTITTVGHTAIYHPGATGQSTWTAGPDFPPRLGSGDSWAALLPSGNVLVETNPADSYDDDVATYQAIRSGAIHPGSPAQAQAAIDTITPVWRFFEFDGTNLIPEPEAYFIGGPASTLLLPTGQVMLNAQAIYTPVGAPSPAWAPVITDAPTSVTAGGSYTISGLQFNGLSQANAYGDEFQVATNYPLVRITNLATQHVFYARTHGHSSMGVATGSMPVSTHFDVPAVIETGPSVLEVVANGIASAPLSITVE
jgi:hypothetical protein